MGTIRIFDYPCPDDRLGELHLQCYNNHMNDVEIIKVSKGNAFVITTGLQDRSLVLWKVRKDTGFWFYYWVIQHLYIIILWGAGGLALSSFYGSFLGGGMLGACFSGKALPGIQKVSERSEDASSWEKGRWILCSPRFFCLWKPWAYDKAWKWQKLHREKRHAYPF